MDFVEYQAAARATADYPEKDSFYGLLYCGLGTAGEGGEVAEVIKKAWRNDGKLTDERTMKLAYEIGDTLWYLANAATEAGLDLETIAEANIIKLTDRKARNVIKSEGDTR
jgi:NTP pyrophosphatase (non-canonical NTP hydrolase)